MSSFNDQDQLGQALVDFSTNGLFPEEEAVSATHVNSSTVSAALAALNAARADLEVSPPPLSQYDMDSSFILRTKSARSAESLPPMSISGLNMPNLYKTISSDLGVSPAVLSDKQKPTRSDWKDYRSRKHTWTSLQRRYLSTTNLLPLSGLYKV